MLAKCLRNEFAKFEFHFLRRSSRRGTVVLPLYHISGQGQGVSEVLTCIQEVNCSTSFLGDLLTYLHYFPFPPNAITCPFVDFVVLLPGYGRSVTYFWGWDAHEAQLRCSDGVWVVIEEDVVPGGALNLNIEIMYLYESHKNEHFLLFTI